eukprot:PhF_6_TR29100/c0_g1_i1/m.42442/K01178/SGA1; glucoamylase
MAFRLLLLVSAVVAVLGQSCNIPDGSKSDCGYVGINSTQCQAKGCCWAQSPNNGVPWCFYAASAGPSPTFPPSGSPPFSDAEMKTIFGYFLNNLNVQGSGAVVAAPDYNTPGGSYYFAWRRDGALSMGALMEYKGYTSQVDYLMQRWVQWQLLIANQTDNLVDVRGEAKFNIPNGTPYQGPWCRPQNDGAGLVAATLAQMGMYLLQGGNTSYVRQYLWTNSSSLNGGLIKSNLDYVISAWQSVGCDLWEELQSNDFYWTRASQRYGFYVAAQFLDMLGDHTTANYYRTQASTIQQTLQSHYNGQFIYENVNRQKDSASLLGVNRLYCDDGFFAPGGVEAAGTVQTFNTLFQNMFPINTVDTQKGIPGILHGRYEGDIYAGGNPWILSTNNLGEVYYRAAKQALESKKVLTHWNHVATNGAFTSYKEQAKVLLSLGDGALLRVRYHTAGLGFHMYEQLDKNTGFETSAKDLTWSYASLLMAMKHRRTTMELFERA